MVKNKNLCTHSWGLWKTFLDKFSCRRENEIRIFSRDGKLWKAKKKQG